MGSLRIVPITLATANEFVAAHHRHNKPVKGGIVLKVGVEDDGELVGVGMAGTPVARMLCDGVTLEARRTCTDGTDHANSMLYGALWRAARALGWQRLITYTQADESGASLRAAGFVSHERLRARKGWDTQSRPADDTDYISTERIRWELRTSGWSPRGDADE